MKIHPFMKFLAPDTGESVSIPALEVPEIAPSSSNATVEEITIPSGIQGPKEALGEDPVDEMERMEAQMEKREPRERGPDGKFLPKGQKKDDTAPTEQPAKVAPKAKTAKPVIPAAPEPVKAPEKLKIGDEEKTSEEWAKEVKEAREKIAAMAKTPEPEAKKEPELKPEEVAAQGAEKIKNFIAEAKKKYLKKPEELDEILSGGEGAADRLAETLANVELSGRQWAATQFNKAIADLHATIQPIREHYQRIADFQGDQGFLEANPTIKDHPQGYATYQAVKGDLQRYYADIQAKAANGTATPVEQAWATIYAGQTPEEFNSNVAAHTITKLAALPPAKSPNAAPAPVVPKSPAASPASKPFSGDRPGGAAARINTESEQARALREMNEREGL